MFKVFEKEIEFGGRTLRLETGKIARQAQGAVLASYGQTVVLCTVAASPTPKAGVDFLPLTVNYQEKSFAAGKIPGGFFKREGRPNEKEVLTSRLIDRPLRPLFAKGYTNETQVICTVLSHDLENDPDIIAMIGASAALTISGLPFLGPIAGARVGYIEGEYVLNPTASQLKDSALDLVVAGTQEGVLMVESEAHELSEQIMLDAVLFGHREMQKVNHAIIDLAEQCAKDAWEIPEKAFDVDHYVGEIANKFREKIVAAYDIQSKQDRQNALQEIREDIMASYDEAEEPIKEALPSLIKKIESDVVRGQILDGQPRIDGRDPKTIRPIVSEVGVLQRAHGSALFTRGETQALVVTTLGTGQDEQVIDALEGEYREHFMLHYNFPPYSVGEASMLRSPGRREIGHGKLAWRAVHPLLPSREAFPYTLRVVSEITESNGSSSMATVCGTSLALMDAGTPLKRPVAGIAMGLIKDQDRFVVLSDILGDEDHLGDMDFKVAGTEEGITALQMDIKITSITKDIMEQALAQARDGRLHILGEMSKALTQARQEVNANAPRIVTMSIAREKIRDVIGTGGKVIREICETTGAKIDIEDDGTIKVSAIDEAATQAAVARIQDIVAEPEIGHIYTGKVVKVVDFGAFVNFMGSRDGLVHISELRPERVNKVTDIVAEGDVVKVKLIGFDNRGKIKLSMKDIDQESGEELA